MTNTTAVVRTAPIAIAPKPTAKRRHFGVGESDPFPATAPTPCEACRRSRVRCTVAMSEDEDGCIPCQANGAECSLVSSPQPRKRKLNGDSDDGVSGKRSPPGRPDTRRRRHHNSSLSSTAGSGSFLEAMANVGGPTLLKRTLGLQDDRYSQYIGPTTDFEPSLINLSPFNPDDESLLARGTLRKVSDNDTFLMLPDSKTPGYEHQIDDADKIEGLVAPHGRRLIDLYFRVVHPGFPIVQKGVFLEKYERSYREFSPALLAAVYILAINWWDHDERLSGFPRPDVKRLEQLVRTTLADAMYRPKLSTVQTGLLLSQRPEGDQWAPTAQLVAVGQELGLHLDCTNWKIPPWEKGLRKRLAWALYMQDKWGALVHGRPSHIFSSNWAVQPISDNDFPDVEWEDGDAEDKLEVERGRLLFMRMVHLSQILAEILETFYTIQAMRAIDACEDGTQMVLSLAKPIQLKLKEWYSALPPTIRMDSATSTNSTLTDRPSPIGSLHLAYFSTEITLHRRIIRSLSASPDSVDSYVQHICRGAAKARLISAMDFVNRLSPGHLRSFWYFASKTNFALIGTFGSLLWATSPGREEAEWYRRRLAEYRWTLSVSSKPGEGKGRTEFAMTMLDISTGLLKKLPEKPSLSPALSRSGSVADIEAGRGFGFPSAASGLASVESLSGLQSADASGDVSPQSDSESSDDSMYELGPLEGMASRGE